MSRIFCILLFLCSVLWAKPNIFIPSVELEGVHQDYADKIVQRVESYLKNQNRVNLVSEFRQSDLILKIKMQLYGDGVIVTYALLDSTHKKEIWSYTHFAYTPNDLIPAVDVVSNKFGEWDGSRWGIGLGALGMVSSDFDVYPVFDLLFVYLYNNVLLSLDGDLSIMDSKFNFFGSYFSMAYVFDGMYFSPYVGPGVGYSTLFYKENDNNYVTCSGLSYFLKMGIFYKPIDSRNLFALDFRFLINDFEYIDKKSPFFGWRASLQIWW